MSSQGAGSERTARGIPECERLVRSHHQVGEDGVLTLAGDPTSYPVCLVLGGSTGAPSGAGRPSTKDSRTDQGPMSSLLVEA